MTILQRPYVFLTKTSLLALIVSSTPLPQTLLEASPFWMLLFFTYWLVNFPAKGSFFLALILGVLIDILHGDILGQNALALILSSVFIIKVKQSFYVSNLSTQQVYVFSAASIYLCSILLVQTLTQTQNFDFSYYLLFAPFTSALFWPVIKILSTKFQH